MATIKDVEIRFPRHNDFWMDSGIIGLYWAIKGKLQPSLLHTQQELPNEKEISQDQAQDELKQTDEREEAIQGELFGPKTLMDESIQEDNVGEKLSFHEDLGKLYEVEVQLNADALVLRGTNNNCENVLQKAFDRIVKGYYNITTSKQKEDKYNFAYFPKENRFKSFPKRNPTGVALLVFDKASSPKKKLGWKDKKKHIISEDFGKIKEIAPKNNITREELQERLIQFLDSHKVIIQNSLWLEKPVVKPTIQIAVTPGKNKGHCFLCGEETHKLVKGTGTSFPLITGESGGLNFYSLAQKPEKICWKCDFIGKFVPANGFFIGGKGSNNLIAFFPHSTSLKKIDEIYSFMRKLFHWHENHVYNFQSPFKTRLAHPHEQTFSFLFYVYKNLVDLKKHKDMAKDELLHSILNVVVEDAPLSFGILQAVWLTDAKMVRQMWNFSDVAYLFRLFHRIENEREKRIDFEKIMRELYDFKSPKPEQASITREKVLEGVLKKRSIWRHIERFLFHVNRHSGNDFTAFHTERFLYIYEQLIHEGDEMFKEQVETAASVGKQIGQALGKAVREGKESSTRAKGSLFRLRKTRTLAAFVNELARIQQRYSLSLSRELYQGDKLTPENFEEFRGFALIAALNTFNISSKPQENEEKSS